MNSNMGIDQLTHQIKKLEDYRRYTQNALEMILALGDFQTAIIKRYTPDKIFKEAEKRINQISPFEVRAFYLVDPESNDLVFSLCKPDHLKQSLEDEMEFMIDQGFIAWAIRERRGVTVLSKNKNRFMLLHVIATFSRIRGIFIGFFHEPRKKIPDASTEILSIILRNVANALESFELYSVMKNQERALIEAHNSLEQRIVERTSELAKANELLTKEIEQRKKADQALQESHEHLKEILISLPVGMIIVDAKSHEIIEVNSPAISMIGANSEQIIGSRCHGFLCPAEECKCPITDLNQTINRSERILLRLDGKEVPVFKSVIKSSIGGRECLIECFTDISEHKVLEKEQFNKAKLQVIIETAGSVCHELNQPLQAIAGYTELILMDIEEDCPYLKKMETIQAQVEKMGKITKKLMSITKYETMEYLNTRILNIDKASE